MKFFSSKKASKGRIFLSFFLSITLLLLVCTPQIEKSNIPTYNLISIVSKKSSSGSTFLSILYPETSYVFNTNEAITTIVPTTTGTYTSCTISPSLPSGLTFNTSDCSISGTPTASMVSTGYQITITDGSYTASTELSISINSTTGTTASPSFFYSSGSYTFQVNSVIATITPTSTDSITGCSSTPALPAGLNLSNSDCSISGTPTSITASAQYTIKAVVSTGELSTGITIEIKLDAPSSLSYSGSPFTYYIGTTITSITPNVTGSVENYSITPALPSGLNLNTTTGVLSGIPTSLSNSTVYTIQATNASGNTSTNITITVKDTSVPTYTDANGLVWKKCPQGLYGTDCTSGTALNVNYSDAVSGASGCTSLNSGTGYEGKTNWRLPNLLEFLSITDYATMNPAITVLPYNNINDYWTSTSRYSNEYHTVSIDKGYVTLISSGSTRYVRCVSGTALQSGTLVDNGDNTIKDNRTGLFWQKCILGQTQNSTCDNVGTFYGWSAAISQCSGLSLAGRTWRLPTLTELYSINDFTIQNSYGSYFNPTYFPNSIDQGYYSSTTFALDSNSAWYFSNYTGINGTSNKITQGYYVRCVSDP